MAMPPGLKSAKMLKDRKKGKSKKDEPKDDEAESKDDKVEAKGDKSSMSGSDHLAKLEADLTKDIEMGEDVEEVIEETGADMGGAAGAADPAAGGDPAKVFADVLEIDELTAQAVYGEAMGLPELAEMSVADMANKIKGNYDLLKQIIMSMGEKAAIAMKEEMNQPMPAPGAMEGMPGGPEGMPPGPGMGGPPPGM